MRPLILYICHENGKEFISNKAETPDAQKIWVLLPYEFDLYWSTDDTYLIEFPSGDAHAVKDSFYFDGDLLVAEGDEDGYYLPYGKID